MFDLKLALDLLANRVKELEAEVARLKKRLDPVPNSGGGPGEPDDPKK